MPDLENSNLENAFRASRGGGWGFAKFIREGNRIYWDIAYTFHTTMVIKAGMAEPEDVGRMMGIPGITRKLRVYGRSADFIVPENPEQRNRTLELFREIADGSDIEIIPERIENILETTKM